MHKILIFCFLFLSFSLQAGFASELEKTSESWEKDKQLLSEFLISDAENCNQMFNLLWKWAKRGNLEARFNILGAMSIIHGPTLILPSPSFDSLTNIRHALILAIHSVGPGFDEDKNKFIDDFVASIHGLGPESTFGRCLQKDRSEECVKLAVKDRKVPSFEDFAREIDLFIDAGYKAHCIGTNHNESTLEMNKD